MSAPKWLTHFGLSRSPFTKAIADEDLWVPSSRKRIVERLVEACRGHEHVLLTGEPGIGKSHLLRQLRRCYEGSDVRVVHAEAESDFQATVRFAAKHSLRLVVKATGHDWYGRSYAPGSLVLLSRAGPLPDYL